MRPILLFALIAFVIFIVLVSAQSLEGSVSINLSPSKVWWNDSVTASGAAKYANGNAIDNSNLNLTIASVNYCTNTTDTSGNYACTFRVPNAIGDYTLVVNVTNSTGYNFTNTTTLSVSPSYGNSPPASLEKVVYEVPMITIDKDGSIKRVWVRVTVWKG